MPIQTFKRTLLAIMAVILGVLMLAACVIQFYVFPNINQYKQRIAQSISNAIHLPVRIQHIGVAWAGISPEITLKQIVIDDSAHRPALHLTQVKARLSWSSLALFAPTLVSLTIDEPNLVVRRDARGELFLAGISMAGQSDPAFANWLLSQRLIEFRHATVTWLDDFRHAPPLQLKDLNVYVYTPVWQRILGRHSLHLDSLVSTGTHQRIKLEAILVGHDVATLADWHGEVSLKLPDTQLSAWQPWVDLPLHVHHGDGHLFANLEFAHKQVKALTATIKMRDLAISPQALGQHFIAPNVAGEIYWQYLQGGWRLALKHFSADIQPGVRIDDANGEWTWQANAHQGELNIHKIRFSETQALSAWLPEAHPWRAPLQQLAAQGVAEQVNASWHYQDQQWQAYALDAVLSQVQTQAYAPVPGLNNWSGKLHIKPHHARLDLNTQRASLDLAGILRAPIPVDTLKGSLQWDDNGQKMLFTAKDIAFVSPHVSFKLNAEYLLEDDGEDYLQLTSQLDKGDAKFAKFYYPITLGADTLHWLDTSILEGQLHHGEVLIKGRLKDFPFVDAQQQANPKLGLFKVTAQMQHGVLDYGTGWPKIDNLDAAIKFEGKRMDIQVKSGQSLGEKIIKAHAEIPRLDADAPVLNLQSLAKGNVEQGILFVNSSPIKAVTQGFMTHLKGLGETELSLQLHIPLLDVDATTVQGDLAIKNASLQADPSIGLPAMQQIVGHLKFTEKNLQAQNLHLTMFDNPAQISLYTRPDKAVVIQGNGRITHTALKKLNNNLLTRALNGTTDWKANLLVQSPLVRLDVRSQLVGMAVNLPAPLNKLAETPTELQIRLRDDDTQADSLAIHYADWLHANMLLEPRAEEMQIRAGELSINTPPRVPTEGVNIRAEFAKLDADAWLEHLKRQSNGEPSANASALLPANYTVDVMAQQLHLFDRDLQQMKLTLQPALNRLHFNVQSPTIRGEADWLTNKQNKLIAKLDYLKIPKPNTSEPSTAVEIRRSTAIYPELDIAAKEFLWGDKQLGTLELKAYNSGENWVIQRMALNNPDSQLVGDGVWRNAVRGPQTQFKFNLSANHLGKTLQRFTPGELIKDGSGNMTGQLSWPGSPHEFAVERLDGSFSLQLEKGQILKVQPGVGRLLGLLSLQSLPRRLTLDFRDLFSEGFAFDRIQCSANMRDGILRSDDFAMTGPAAEVKIKGETNLKAETQRLKVKVVPHISDSVSLAALAGGPIVGVAAFIAQKLLKDPLNKITASEYMIVGTWDAPQEVEAGKTNASSPALGPR